MRSATVAAEPRSLTIGADPDRLAEAREWAAGIAAGCGLAAGDCFMVKLALSEAVTNAIQHGSDGAATDGKAVEIAAFEDGGALVFEIRDNGTFVAPEVRATAESESGRGLELLTLTMDEVHIDASPGGTVVRFAKRLA
ncbi:MAG: ATP-binding protein [Solirubrobacterales bacterium]|nr:ATP-binding protein [Solirubrobacterales bacterium]